MRLPWGGGQTGHHHAKPKPHSNFVFNGIYICKYIIYTYLFIKISYVRHGTHAKNAQNPALVQVTGMYSTAALLPAGRLYVGGQEMGLNDGTTAIIMGFYQYQWIGLRENLQETMVFTIKYRAFL